MSISDVHARVVATIVWARRQGPYLTVAEGDLLVRLVSYLGAQGCFPSIPTLERETGRSKSMLHVHLRELERLGLIVTQRRGARTYRHFYTTRSLAEDAIAWARAQRPRLSDLQASVLESLVANGRHLGPSRLLADVVDRDAIRRTLDELEDLELITVSRDARGRITFGFALFAKSDPSDPGTDATPGAGPTHQTSQVRPVRPGVSDPSDTELQGVTTEENYGEERACARDPHLDDLIERLLHVARANGYHTAVDGENAPSTAVVCDSCAGKHLLRVVQRHGGSAVWCVDCRERQPLELALRTSDDVEIREQAVREVAAATCSARHALDLEAALIASIARLTAEAGGQSMLALA